MNKKDFALECATHIFSEKRIELYEWYCSRVSQLKYALSAETDLRDQTWFGLGKQGA